MKTANSNLPTDRFGEDASLKAGAMTTASTVHTDAAIENTEENKPRIVTRILNNKTTIIGSTAVAIMALVTVFYLLPAPDVGGRVLCFLGIALSYWVGQEWYKNSAAPQVDALSRTDPSVLQAIDHKMEQLEDAKWQLSDSAAHYRDLLDQHHDMIVRRNSAGNLTFANRAFCRKFNIDLEAALGHPLQKDAIKSVELPLSPDLEVGSEASQRHYRDLIETRDGQRWIEWEAHHIDTGDGFEVQYTGRDVTEAVNAHQALEDARDQAQIANRSKSRFLASMSHEIRTPMNGILGMARLLNDEKLSAQKKTYVNAIDLSARNLLAIIDEILDFSKIEAGKITLSEHYFSIEDIVLSVVELLAPSAQEKGLEIAWTVDQAASGEFVGDAARVRQILLNLVSNAVKFTDRGGIRVSVTGKDIRDDRKCPLTGIQIRVSDTGIGLSKDDQRALFAEFAQTDQAVKRQSGGTGLGLAISKRLAEAMGGGLRVESNVSTGSTFIASLELQPIFGVSVGQNFAALQENLNLKVLLAFERVLERSAMAEVLSDAGIAVVECDLEEATSLVKLAAQNGHPFSRIVVDAGADSDMAAAVLNNAVEAGCAHGLQHDDVRGLVLVSMSSRETLPKFQSLGFDSYLVRPVRPKTMFEQLISERSQVDHVSYFETSDVKEPPRHLIPDDLRFLLVEDNDINAMLVEHQLKRLGYTVKRVVNGLEAVGTMQQVLSGDLAPFDVILMDVLLPEMDGLEATKKIKHLFACADVANRQPPVIALTANAFKEDKQRCLDAGMDNYLAKPFDQDMLISVLEQCNLP